MRPPRPSKSLITARVCFWGTCTKTSWRGSNTRNFSAATTRGGPPPRAPQEAAAPGLRLTPLATKKARRKHLAPAASSKAAFGGVTAAAAAYRLWAAASSSRCSTPNSSTSTSTIGRRRRAPVVVEESSSCLARLPAMVTPCSQAKCTPRAKASRPCFPPMQHSKASLAVTRTPLPRESGVARATATKALRCAPTVTRTCTARCNVARYEIWQGRSPRTTPQSMRSLLRKRRKCSLPQAVSRTSAPSAHSILRLWSSSMVRTSAPSSASCWEVRAPSSRTAWV
mmetsp:Transcript_10226/g.21552  ORF Transcript_10226/g.21552 Transcript_10226/m.21552 type:complete len:283 (+) Transcript_10226:261-1109(+)